MKVKSLSKVSKAGSIAALVTAMTMASGSVFADSVVDKLISKGQAKVISQQEMTINELLPGVDLGQKIKAMGIESVAGDRALVIQVGDYVFTGQILDKNGVDITRSLAKKLIPPKDVSAVIEDIAKNPDKYPLIEEGSNKNAPLIYVFAEPVCPACKMFHQQIKPLIKGGKVRVIWIMTSFLSPQSPGLVSTILNADNPAEKLSESYDNLSGHSTKLKPSEVTPEIKEKIKNAMNAMQKAGVEGTPGIIVKRDYWQKWTPSEPLLGN